MFPVGDGLLEKIRIGQNKDNDGARGPRLPRTSKDHTIFYLENPTRLVVDVRGTAAPPAPMIAGRPAPTVVATNASRSRSTCRPIGPLRRRPSASSRPGSPPLRRCPCARWKGWMCRGCFPRPCPTPSSVLRLRPSRGRRRATHGRGRVTRAVAFRRRPRPETRVTRARPAPTRTTAPAPPQVNRAGSYSLARQLGLGARKIVIDAGHGGHDPGTLGRGGLQEKDLVLDVAVRLQRLVRDELGAEVVMTRSTDVFVPLEERTAIANAQGADLFLSIHANSSRNPGVRGIETYFLNFAQDPHAEAVAARENAISAATLKDLQNLVKAIALNSKIDESRDFASSVQEAMVQTIRPIAPDVSDRGVRTAPFYVLIGANMPSILAEIAFVSNPQEERLLRTPEHR